MRPLVAWSGGADSTAVVIWYFSHNIEFETVYVKLPNNKNIQKRELIARRKLLLRLTDLYGDYCVKDHIVEFTTALEYRNHVPPQAYIWAVSISYNFDLSKYSKLSFGYILNDDFWHYKNSFEKLISVSQNFFEKVHTEFEYMLEWHDKEYIIENFYYFDKRVKELLKLTEYCGEINKIENCTCKKCKQHKKALLDPIVKNG